MKWWHRQARWWWLVNVLVSLAAVTFAVVDVASRRDLVNRLVGSCLLATAVTLTVTIWRERITMAGRKQSSQEEQQALKNLLAELADMRSTIQVPVYPVLLAMVVGYEDSQDASVLIAGNAAYHEDALHALLNTLKVALAETPRETGRDLN